MKFLKEDHRQRANKNIECHQEQENQPPMSQEFSCKANTPALAPLRQAEPVLTSKEEEAYLSEILHYMSGLKPTFSVPCDYFKIQTDITEHMRSVLLNWLIDVHMKYKLQTETLFLTVHILDKYLSTEQTCRSQLQLVGITALWIASKYSETYQVPKINNLVFICDSTYTKEEILCMEMKIIQVTEFNLLVQTEIDYFHAIHKVREFEDKDYFLCRYILEICLFDVHFKKFHPKLLAISVAYLVRKLRKNAVCWSLEEQQMFQVEEVNLKQCARDVCMFWQQADEVETLHSLRNKFQSPGFREVTKIKIGQANQASQDQRVEKKTLRGQLRA